MTSASFPTGFKPRKCVFFKESAPIFELGPIRESGPDWLSSEPTGEAPITRPQDKFVGKGPYISGGRKHYSRSVGAQHCCLEEFSSEDWYAPTCWSGMASFEE